MTSSLVSNADGSVTMHTPNGAIVIPAGSVTPDVLAALSAAVASLAAPVAPAVPVVSSAPALPNVSAPPGAVPVNFGSMLAPPPPPPPSVDEVRIPDLVTPEVGAAIDRLKKKLRPFMSLTGCTPDVFVERWHKADIAERSERAWRTYDDAQALVEAARVVTDAGIPLKF